MVNKILRNENYTGTLFQGKKRKLNYRVNKQIDLDRGNWIIPQIIMKQLYAKKNLMRYKKFQVIKKGTELVRIFC